MPLEVFGILEQFMIHIVFMKITKFQKSESIHKNFYFAGQFDN